MDWISPVLNGVGSLIGGFTAKKGAENAAKMQYKIAQETNANNYKIAQENNAFNERMVDKMNEYNSAVNQRKRLEEAGLNPYLMMDGGSAGTATTAPTADTSSVQHAPDVASSISQGSIALGSSISNAASPAFFGLHPKGESFADKTALDGASPPTIFIVTYFISVSIPGFPPAAGFFAFDIF